MENPLNVCIQNSVYLNIQNVYNIIMMMPVFSLSVFHLVDIYILCMTPVLIQVASIL